MKQHSARKAVAILLLQLIIFTIKARAQFDSDPNPGDDPQETLDVPIDAYDWVLVGFVLLYATMGGMNVSKIMNQLKGGCKHLSISIVNKIKKLKSWNSISHI